jgi:PAS domain S-box-containing protein
MSSPIRVLHLERDADDCEHVRLLLLNAGFECEVRRIDTCEEFTRALHGQEWDLILADYGPTSFDGITALQVAREVMPATPFILIANSITEDVAIDSMKLGATDFVIKEKLERLVPAVLRALREADCRRHAAAIREALRNSESQVRLLLDSAAEAIFGADLDGNCTFCNRSCAFLLGYSLPSQLLGKNMHDVLHGPRADGPPCSLAGCRVRAAVEKTEALRLDNEVLSRRDGTTFIAEVWSQPIRRDGAVVGMVVNFMDVTERKHAQQELENRARDLARSNAELQQFAYLASHDLQEPLRMVVSYTQLLAHRYRGKIDADADQFIAFAVEGAARMQRLIEDLLAYCRVDTRAKRFAEMDCNNAADEAVNNLTAALEETHAVVTHDPLPVIIGDDSQICQAFQNLIANGIKFHGPELPRIHISAELEPGMWRFSVRDNGIGIAPDNLNRLFVIFQRLHTHDEYPGSGIGLAITKKIVERHGGRVWVESELGKGSTFYLTIPVRSGIDRARTSSDGRAVGERCSLEMSS